MILGQHGKSKHFIAPSFSTLRRQIICQRPFLRHHLFNAPRQESFPKQSWRYVAQTNTGSTGEELIRKEVRQQEPRWNCLAMYIIGQGDDRFMS
jgi:hypothetical protein